MSIWFTFCLLCKTINYFRTFSMEIPPILKNTIAMIRYILLPAYTESALWTAQMENMIMCGVVINYSPYMFDISNRALFNLCLVFWSGSWTMAGKLSAARVGYQERNSPGTQPFPLHPGRRWNPAELRGRDCVENELGKEDLDDEDLNRRQFVFQIKLLAGSVLDTDSSLMTVIVSIICLRFHFTAHV